MAQHLGPGESRDARPGAACCSRGSGPALASLARRRPARRPWSRWHDPWPPNRLAPDRSRPTPGAERCDRRRAAGRAPSTRCAGRADPRRVRRRAVRAWADRRYEHTLIAKRAVRFSTITTASQSLGQLGRRCRSQRTAPGPTGSSQGTAFRASLSTCSRVSPARGSTSPRGVHVLKIAQSARRSRPSQLFMEGRQIDVGEPRRLGQAHGRPTSARGHVLTSSVSALFTRSRMMETASSGVRMQEV